MKTSCAYTVLAAFVAADDGTPAVDCSSYLPWTPKVVGNPVDVTAKMWKVWKDGQAYQATTWVESTQIPGGANAGEWSPWVRVGGCSEGTSGDGDSGVAGTVDCTGVHAWSPIVTYKDSKSSVHSEGQLYQAFYWNQAMKPSRVHAQAWQWLGKCTTGTDRTGPDETARMPPQWKLDMTCQCCDTCGTIIGGQVFCKDVQEPDCYFKWCGAAGETDDAKCNDLKSGGKLSWWDGQLTAGKTSWPKQVYAPYVDAGLPEWPPLTELASQSGVKYYMMAFVVAKSDKCEGAWGGVHNIETGTTQYNAGEVIYLYDELNKLRSAGGDFAVSFGGSSGTELADSADCQSGDAVGKLVKEYGRVMDQMNTTRIDFDIEGGAASATNAATGWSYRFEAMKELKSQRPALKVSWTLPVLPTGLVPEGVAFFKQLLDQGAPWDIINVMTMDFGECPTTCDPEKIDECERNAIDSVAQQLYDTVNERGEASAYGWTSKTDVYPRLGSTPMVGMNDVHCLTYTLAAAKTNLAHWQKNAKIGMIGNWSVGRDRPCASEKSYVDLTCSSYSGQTEDYQFAKVFAGYTRE